MPAHSDDGSSQADPNAVSVAGPRPFSPTLPSDGECKADGVLVHPAPDAAAMSPPASDNTAAGMSLQQEDSIYSTPDAPRDTNTADSEKDKPDVVMAEERNDAAPTKQADHEISSPREDTHAPVSPASLDVSRRTCAISQLARADRTTNTQLQTPSPTLSDASVASVLKTRQLFQTSGAPTIDRELHQISESKPWEFSRRNVKSQYPSALFQTGSNYIGTQQSDRQIYNVEVTILTVDMEQCTTSGYLQICGLTPDHPTLTTFFTGEIIGGPDQKFGFRTKTSEWGATDKTDMTHWARFPAWRSLSSQAKQDLSFVHPSDQSPWWQQESIFMRWKEHFLVPDYKLRSIQGASFEGFYYICLNQIEAKISGIYFHSKSEKYQQLELKHEGVPQAWSRGGCSSSRQVDAEDVGRPPQPQVRESPQPFTSETAINPSSSTRQPRALQVPSTTSPHPSDTSRSRTSTPQRSTTTDQSRPQPVDLAEHYNLPLQAPKPWKSKDKTWTRAQLRRERYEFFETRVTGRRETWAALKQAAECVRDADIATAQGILDAVGVTLPTGRMEDGGYDENGNLYRISETIMSDPTNLVDEDGDDQTVVGTAESKEVTKVVDDEHESKEIMPEPTQQDKGKAVVDKDAMKVKCRLSDRGGPDVVVLLGRVQTVGVLCRRIRDEGDVLASARVRIAYLGMVLNDKQTLLEQGWKEGHVVNALITGVYST